MVSARTLLEIIQIIGLGLFVLLGYMWFRLEEKGSVAEREQSLFFVLFIFVITIVAFAYVVMMRLSTHNFMY